MVVTRAKRRRESPTMAIPGRSAHVQDAVATVASKLGPSATIPVDRLLAALVNPHMARCGFRFEDGSICEGMRGLVERECTKVGSKLTLTFKCSHCAVRTSIVSSSDTGMVEVPDGDGGTIKFKKRDIRKVLLVLLAGSTYSQYGTIGADGDLISKSQFYRIQKVLVHAIMATSDEYFDAFRRQMATDLNAHGLKWVASADGAWSHRGWRARHHTYLVRDFKENSVVCCVVLKKDHIVHILDGDGQWVVKNCKPGNYMGTSKGMEGEAFVVAMDQIVDAGLDSLMDKIVLDGDSGVRHLLDNNDGDFEGVQVAGDPGHRKKNFAKALAKIFPATGARALYPWRISMFFIRCLKRAEKEYEGFTEEVMLQRKERFEELWSHAYAHYTRQHCPEECPCQHRNVEGDDDDAVVEEEDDAGSTQNSREVNALMGLLDLRDAAQGDDDGEIEIEEVRAPKDAEEVDETSGKKDWLDESKPKDAKICQQLKILLDQAAQDVGEILWGLNTCMSECSNSRRLKFCRKDRYFYASYEARSTVSAMLENLSPVEVLDRVYVHFGFVRDAEDEEIRGRLKEIQERREWDSQRKQSVEYKRRAGALNKKMAIERRLELVADKRTMTPGKRAYNKAEDKVLGAEHPRGSAKKAKVKQSNPFRANARAGKTSQEELQRRLDNGERIMKCGHCGTLYLKTHRTCGPAKSNARKPPIAAKAVSDYSEAELEAMLAEGKVKRCEKEGCGQYYFSRHRGCVAKKPASKSSVPMRKRSRVEEADGERGLAAGRTRRGRRQTWSHLLDSGDEDAEDGGEGDGDAFDPEVVARAEATVRQEQAIYDYAAEHELQVNARVESNGNCFFSACSFQLNLIGRAVPAAQMREEVVTHVHEMQLEQQGLQLILQDATHYGGQPIGDLHAWEAYMKQDRVWADELCLKSAAHLYGIRIKVVRAQEALNGVYETIYGEGEQMIVLGYTLSRHYYSLEPMSKRKKKK